MKSDIKHLNKNLEELKEETKEYHEAHATRFEKLTDELRTFGAIVGQVTQNTQRVAELEAKIEKQIKRINRLEAWRSFLTGVVSILGSLVALGIIKIRNLF